ncbi:uncharacterized protein [Littorina saxatilis]|uniref:uncharacterized protein n=1 Tax=Littorina saxatilis TaxID=31220 RepID=UPI0038B668C8
MSNEAVFEAVNVYASVEMTEDTVPLPHLRQFEDEDDIPLIRLKPGRQDEDENDVPMRHLEQGEDEDNIPLINTRKGRQDEDDNDVPLSHLRQVDDEDDIPLPHLRQFEDEDDIPLIRLKPGRQDEDENDVPMRHLEQGEDEDNIPLINPRKGRQDEDDNDVPLSHLRQVDDEDDIPLSHLRNVDPCIEMEHESDGDVPLPTINQCLTTECAESEASSDHLSDGDDYVPSKEELKFLDCSSSEMSWDEDYGDAVWCSTAGHPASSENQEEVTDPEHIRSEQTRDSDASNTLIGSPTAGHSQATSPFTVPTQDKPRQSRKRLRHEDDWKENKRKRLRNNGESYVSRAGKLKRKRELKSGCGDQCRNKCKSKVSEDERIQIFHSFWKLGCLTQQRQYLCKTVKKREKKSTHTKSSSRRGSTYEYHLHIHGKIVKVCKKMFLDTLDISDTVVATSLKNINSLGTCDAEKRGKQSQRGNSKDSEKDEIRKHINSFARVESHYARKDSTREYLESSLSLLKMYELYVQKREKEGCKAPASETTYRYVFNREFNISFHKRMKDRCDICAAYENGYYDHTEEGEYKKHNQMKEDSRKFKDEVKARLKDDPSLAAAVFDLEEVLPTPSSVESCLYYKRKLNTYNLTVYDYRNGQGYCNVWAETASSRGSNEIASCVYRYLERISKEGGVKKVVLFSDSCGGQNRNKNFLTMLWYALTKFHFDEIEHVFFVSGHSQNEGDSMHSVIERMSRHVAVYTPSQWAQNMRTAKRHAPLYIVDELVQSDFFDFKKVAELLKNFQLDTKKEKVRWLDVKRFKLSSQEPNVVDVGYDYTGDYCQLNLVRKLRAVHSIPDPADIVLENVSKAPLPITKEKYNDLVNLCERYIIPKAHHHYFRSLPHDA